MPGLLPNVDPEGLLEYSVVYTDRALNHMSISFQEVMKDISSTLKEVYSAFSVVVVPGSGTFAMEAVARQFGHDKKCFIVRNGWFSYRWSQILEMGKIPSSIEVLKAEPISSNEQSPFVPPNIDGVVAAIKKDQPDLIFAPHVETSSGMMLTDDYILALSDAAHSVGAMLVLDCIASGAMWVDMQKCGVDILISAPQKGWSGSPCCGLVMMSSSAVEKMMETQSSSFSCDLKKWHEIMQAYLEGKHAYHATMPTDGLRKFRDVMQETKDFGFDRAFSSQKELGDRIRRILKDKGFKSVAADGYGAPGVVVSYTSDPFIKSGQKFLEYGIQIAAGVPLKCEEMEPFQTFRVGLFGLDKLMNVDRTVSHFNEALDKVLTTTDNS